ncbi:MAG: hypothetical protein F4213_10465 [Boseongicola sp. SB0677_bin_26]|nr:hypothetical protein [Boseongicola sp. SB0677_bin_26]
MYYYGDFYKLNGRPCRSTLEIVTSSVPPDARNRLLLCQPDIVVVMMNPGASKPCARGDGQGWCPREVGSTSEIGTEAALVPTYPDKTQLAIAEVMRRKEFGHARVLNLSDVREPKSSNFLRGLENNCLPQGHSVFCSQRVDELEDRLKPMTEIVIAAWGTDYRLRALAKTALVSFKSRNLRIHGWDNHPFFRHPGRNSEDWLQSILPNWPC